MIIFPTGAVWVCPDRCGGGGECHPKSPAPVKPTRFRPAYMPVPQTPPTQWSFPCAMELYLQSSTVSYLTFSLQYGVEWPSCSLCFLSCLNDAFDFLLFSLVVVGMRKRVFLSSSIHVLWRVPLSTVSRLLGWAEMAYCSLSQRSIKIIIFECFTSKNYVLFRECHHKCFSCGWWLRMDVSQEGLPAVTLRFSLLLRVYLFTIYPNLKPCWFTFHVLVFY